MQAEKPFYEAITATEGAYYTQNRWEFRKAIKTILASRAMTVLDAGCGDGDFLRQLQKEGDFECHGFDFNPGVAKTLAAQGFGVANHIDQPLKNEGFDVVTCLQVMEHLDDPWTFR